MTTADKMMQGAREAQQPENGVFPGGAENPWPPTALLAGHKYGRMVHVVIMVPADDVEKLPHEMLRSVGRVAAGG